MNDTNEFTERVTIDRREPLNNATRLSGSRMKETADVNTEATVHWTLLEPKLSTFVLSVPQLD